MEATLFKKYIQNIEDFIFIEGKIVTYLWLCQVLKIHINTAKQLLYAFSIKDDVKNKLLVTYVLGGELKNGKGKLLKLVIADSREAVKQVFSKITTDHVYSIQRSGGSFSSTDIFNSYPHFSVNVENRKFCTIQPNKAIEKREVKHIIEVKNFLNNKAVKKPSLPKANEEAKKEVKDDNKTQTKTDNTIDSSEPPLKKMKTASEKDVKSKPGGIGNFFSRQAQKKNSESAAENKEKPDKKEEKAKTGIGAFFTPGNKNVTASKEVKEKETVPKLSPKEVVNGTEVKGSKDSNNVKQPETTSTKDKKSRHKENKRKRKKKDGGKENEGKKKRRKRILSAFSSDSESSGNETSECEMEVEPEQPPPPPADDEEDMIPPTPGRKRVRKQIDKLFTDEEGYLLTKKEFVYESCSDDEAKEEKSENKENNTKEVKTSIQKTPEIKKEISPKNVKKTKSTINDKSNKQCSITNFFKRKVTS